MSRVDHVPYHGVIQTAAGTWCSVNGTNGYSHMGQSFANRTYLLFAPRRKKICMASATSRPSAVRPDRSSEICQQVDTPPNAYKCTPTCCICLCTSSARTEQGMELVIPIIPHSIFQDVCWRLRVVAGWGATIIVPPDTFRMAFGMAFYMACWVSVAVVRSYPTDLPLIK